MNDEVAYYTFLPWLKQGISTQIAAQINTETDSEKHIELPITLNIQTHNKDTQTMEDLEPITKKIKLYGPGEVTGFDPRIVIRTDPKANIGDFEPNFFPAIEFAEPDFPWRFTPLKATFTRYAEKEEEEQSGKSPAIQQPYEGRTLAVETEQSQSAFTTSKSIPVDPKNVEDEIERKGFTSGKQITSGYTKLESEPSLGITIPEKPTLDGHLLPWLCLIVLKAEGEDKEFKELDINPNNPLPQLTVDAKNLPDLTQSWAWAHVQVFDEIAGEDLSKRKGDLRRQWRETPQKLISRLVCPRKLEPGVAYAAFVVPTFDIGRKAGLGETINDSERSGDELKPAWNKEEEITLPVYYYWHFRTGLRGDFEYLVRILKPLIIDDRDGKIGKRNMDVIEPGFNVSSVDRPEDKEGNEIELSLRQALALEGALVATNFEPMFWTIPNDFQRDIVELLNLPFYLLNPAEALNSDKESAERIVTPPIYGRWHAAIQTVDSQDTELDESDTTVNKGWINQLNLDPRQRAVSGFGTRAVQEQQEDLMASAWEQVGAIEEANQALREAQLASVISNRIMAKHFSSLTAEQLINLTAPAQSRVLHHGITVAKSIQSSPIPNAVVSSAFRRIARPAGVLRRSFKTNRFTASNQIVQRINSGSLTIGIPGAAITPPPVSTQPIGFGRRVAAAGLTSQKPFVRQTIQGSSASFAEQNVVLNERLYTADRIRKASPQPNFEISESPATSQQTAISDQQTDSADAEFFRKASVEMLEYINQPVVEKPQPKPLKLKEIKKTILEKLNPGQTILARIQQRFEIDLTEKREDPLDTIMAAPTFPRPMYEPLRDLSQDYLLPGVEFIPQNTISLLNTNQRFVEAYMVGLNHEMSGELLWREYPTDQRGTYFRQFWDVRNAVSSNEDEENQNYSEENEDLMDIQPIHLWNKDNDNDLGENKNRTLANDEESLVLLIRGDLLKKYPNTIVYATPAAGTSENREFDSEKADKYPIFRGTIPPDITFFGFDKLTAEQAKGDTEYPAGWYFVLQEQPAEPRFGLDEVTGPISEITKWNDITWEHVKKGNNQYIDLNLEEQPELTDANESEADDEEVVRDQVRRWNSHAGDMAYITLQRPVRIAVHASQMLPPGIGE